MVIPQLWSPCLYQSILFATEESNLSKMQLPCQHPFVKKKKKSLKCWVKTRTFPITGYIKSFPTCPKYLSSPFHTCRPNHGVLSSLIFIYGDSLPQIPSKLSPYVPPFPFTCLILPLHVYLDPFLSQVGYLTSDDIVLSHCKGCDLSFLLVNEQQEDYPLSLYLTCIGHCLELRAYLTSANAILLLKQRHMEGTRQVCAPGHQSQKWSEDLLQGEYGRR